MKFLFIAGVFVLGFFAVHLVKGGFSEKRKESAQTVQAKPSVIVIREHIRGYTRGIAITDRHIYRLGTETDDGRVVGVSSAFVDLEADGKKRRIQFARESGLGSTFAAEKSEKSSAAVAPAPAIVKK